MNTKEIREHKKTLKLNKKQRDIIVGLLLGDGHLETQDNGRTYRLKVEHGMQQKDYVDWLYSEFKDWIPANTLYKKVRKNGQESTGFTTYSHGALRFYGKAFYDVNNVKYIPKTIKKLIKPMGMAVWFMDDGSRKSLRHNTYNIHTLGYTKKDLALLQEVLKELFGIETKLHSQKGKYWRMYIPASSTNRFTELIEEYVKPIKSMQKKLVTTLPKK